MLQAVSQHQRLEERRKTAGLQECTFAPAINPDRCVVVLFSWCSVCLTWRFSQPQIQKRCRGRHRSEGWRDDVTSHAKVVRSRLVEEAFVGSQQVRILPARRSCRLCGGVFSRFCCCCSDPLKSQAAECTFKPQLIAKPVAGCA
jgi:hypothetical protein